HSVGVRGNPLGAEHVIEPIADLGGAYALEVEALESAEDGRGGRRDFLRLRRGEHEHDARRRLLENLEQRVPRLAREHVRLVHYVDLVACIGGRRVHRALPQLPRIVHAAVGGRVDLHHVEARRAAPDAAAGLALAAWLARLRIGAVERHGEDARERRLSHAAWPAEEVAVRHTPALDRPLERRRDVLLHSYIGKALGAVLAGECESHEGLCGSASLAESAIYAEADQRVRALDRNDQVL